MQGTLIMILPISLSTSCYLALWYNLGDLKKHASQPW